MTMTDTPLPEGFTIRAPRIEDAEEVAALFNARSLADTGTPHLPLETILIYWGEPERDLEDDDWLVIAPDGRIVGFLELYEFAPYTIFDFDGVVHPDFEGRGIGSRLLEIIEARARRELHRAPAGEPVRLQTEVLSTNLAAHRLFESRGFSHIRDGLRMRIDLDAPPEVRLPDGVSIRPAVRGQDERSVWEAAEAVWQDVLDFAPMPFEEFIYYRVESLGEKFDPTLWHLAEVDGQLAGFALCLIGKAGGDDSGWVSLLGVRREFRGRGVGLALLQHAFADFFRRGYRTVSLGVDRGSLTGADRFYLRAGMREVKRLFVYEKELRGGKG
jgi:mycothiol synthase